MSWPVCQSRISGLIFGFFRPSPLRRCCHSPLGETNTLVVQLQLEFGPYVEHLLVCVFR
jgi:hypothetical protein